MKETLTFAGVLVFPAAALLVHRTGFAHSVRCIGAWFYAVAFGFETGRREFARLRAESRRG